MTQYICKIPFPYFLNTKISCLPKLSFIFNLPSIYNTEMKLSYQGEWRPDIWLATNHPRWVRVLKTGKDKIHHSNMLTYSTSQDLIMHY